MDSHTVHEIIPQPKKRGRTKVKMVAVSTQPPQKPPNASNSQKRARTGDFDHNIPFPHSMPDLSPLEAPPDQPPFDFENQEPMDSAYKVNPNIYVRHSGKTSKGTVRYLSFPCLACPLMKLIHTDPSRIYG